MRRLTVVLWMFVVAGWSVSAHDLPTGGFPPGSGKAKILPVGVSADGALVAYLEMFSPPAADYSAFRVTCGLFVVDVRQNDWALEPLYETAEVDYLDLRDRSFDLLEYDLARRTLAAARAQLESLAIVPGLWPVRAQPLPRPGEETSAIHQAFELLNTELGTSGGFLLQVLPNPDRLLDLRLSIYPDLNERAEWILQRDSRLPSWREAVREYGIDGVYLYGQGRDRLIVVFLKLRLKPSETDHRGVDMERYMCVTGTVTEAWKKVEENVSRREAEAVSAKAYPGKVVRSTQRGNRAADARLAESFRDELSLKYAPNVVDLVFGLSDGRLPRDGSPGRKHAAHDSQYRL
jgi:hypothetical protein